MCEFHQLYLLILYDVSHLSTQREIRVKIVIWFEPQIKMKGGGCWREVNYRKAISNAARFITTI